MNSDRKKDKLLNLDLKSEEKFIKKKKKEKSKVVPDRSNKETLV